MQRSLLITTEPIDEIRLVSSRSMSQQMGAAIYFAGIVRATESGTPIQALEYEAFQEMAAHQFHLIFDQIENRWPIESIRVVHRIGLIGAGEPSLWVEIIAPHRAESFSACQFLIEEMKRTVPIWKRPVPTPNMSPNTPHL